MDWWHGSSSWRNDVLIIIAQHCVHWPCNPWFWSGSCTHLCQGNQRGKKPGRRWTSWRKVKLVSWRMSKRKRLIHLQLLFKTSENTLHGRIIKKSQWNNHEEEEGGDGEFKHAAFMEMISETIMHLNNPFYPHIFQCYDSHTVWWCASHGSVISWVEGQN